MRLRNIVPLIGAIVVGCADADQSTVTDPRKASPAALRQILVDNPSLTGPTSITEPGTYAYEMCYQGQLYIAYRFKIKKNSSTLLLEEVIPGNPVPPPFTGILCKTLNLPVNTQANFTLHGEAWDAYNPYQNNGNTPVLSVSVNLFTVAISGPGQGQNPFYGTWTGSITNAGTSVGPYTYTWSNALSGTGSSISGTLYNETAYTLTLTVTSANGKTATADKVIYVCADIC